MVDHWANLFLSKKMDYISSYVPYYISANLITVTGFAIGLFAATLIYLKFYILGLVMVIANRFFDGIDGAVARRNGITSFGGYLDILCDFIFYSAVIFAFAMSNPEKNSLVSVFLVFSFVGTGTSFLAFAAIVNRYDLLLKKRIQKAFFYMRGFVEGTETILFFVIVCFFPDYFPVFALIFGILCWITVFGRIGYAYYLLR